MIDRTRGYHDTVLETMPAGERGAHRDALVRAAVVRAYGNAPAARRVLDGAGVRPGEVRGIADLRGIPPTRKADLKAIQRRELPFGGLSALPPREMRRIYVSPGPTYDPEGRAASHWRWESALVAAGFREGDIVQNTFAYHLSPAGLMFDEALLRIGCTVVPAGTGNTELQAQVIRDLAVTGYVGTPSFLAAILEKTREAGVGREELGLQVALVAGEMLPEPLRTALRDDPGIAVRQCYGTADVGCVAYECPEAKGMHLHDGIVVELLDPATGEPAPAGAIGEVVVTLPDDTYPLIRFGTGDLSLLDEAPCPCGRTSERLVRIVGRVDQVTKVRGMFVHPEQVLKAERSVPGVATLQAVVTREGHDDRLLLRAVLREGTAPAEELREAIAAAFREATRLRGEVAFAAPGDLAEKDRKILDLRKWD